MNTQRAGVDVAVLGDELYSVGGKVKSLTMTFVRLCPSSNSLLLRFGLAEVLIWCHTAMAFELISHRHPRLLAPSLGRETGEEDEQVDLHRPDERPKGRCWSGFTIRALKLKSKHF